MPADGLPVMSTDYSATHTGLFCLPCTCGTVDSTHATELGPQRVEFQSAAFSLLLSSMEGLRGCDGVILSAKTYDLCGVCGGVNQCLIQDLQVKGQPVYTGATPGVPIRRGNHGV